MEPIEEQELTYLRNALKGIDLKDIARKIKKSETTTRNAMKHGIGTRDTWQAIRKQANKSMSARNQKETV